MSNTLPRAGFALAAALTIVPIAAAQDTEGGKWTANAGIFSDYVWRGVSQTDNGPALQAGADYTNGMFYAGVWASNVDFGGDADIEADLYAGLTRTYDSGFKWDLGVIGYVYPGDNDLDFLELKAGVGYTLDKVTFGAEVYYDPDNKNTYVEGSAGVAFTEAFTGDVTLGDFDFDGGGSYTNWSVGGTYNYNDIVSIGVRYTDTDIDSAFAGDAADENFVISLSKTFG